jgi:hypothetical protein
VEASAVEVAVERAAQPLAILVVHVLQPMLQACHAGIG